VTLKFVWEEKYRGALLELSAEELQQRIDAARNAIEQRVEELERTGESSAEEQQAIDDAIRALRVLARTECQGGRPPEFVLSKSESVS
jgi:predicted  nucleic acid-binding Zn-ribbon protein